MQGQWSRQPATILRWFAAVISFLDAATLQHFIMQMAVPIFRISEDPNAQDPQMGASCFSLSRRRPPSR